ncbi:TetR/AcrR family transcriptional regulator [Antrihabitans sp. YC2-6]|uniref:TetR/AcrR family transcriptional regulator n=1 Tax=Antrihabitans sp. YC2-6 TaxID=2799498 RepID=UPI0018F3DCE1|nr:TetR/AcrR family transcriptional regulator [Antrihabitans sp. YC2-6]MBJ8344799.1 TetR/AcrR family transcriptional regulator [Antrihabitans sp. YC2-6]
MTAQETSDRLEARRADLIRTATELILGKGYRNTSVADIVGALGLSHGTFYNYFDSRRDILDAVIDHGGKLLTQRLVGPDEPTSAETLDEFLAQVARINNRVHELVADEPALLQFVVFEAASIDEAVVQRMLATYQAFAAASRSYVENGIERGFLRSDLDPEVAGEALATVLLSSTIGALGDGVAADAAVSTAALVDFVRHGMGNE